MPQLARSWNSVTSRPQNKSLSRRTTCFASLAKRAGPIDKDLCVQLATAKLPEGCDKEAFNEGMYQWAATLTSSGQNMPFVLPIQADKTPVGFDLAFLRLIEGTPSRTGRICCSVEDVPEGKVFFARFYAGDDPLPDGTLPPGTDEERLQVLLDSLPDVPVIMRTMAPAIRKIVAASCE